tara:strand:- start:1021 stop:1359 length:339 start_codon:yes stop_codon:yes gene_type:complete
MTDTKNRREGDTQILLLQQKLDNHIDDFHEHCAAEDKRWDRFISTQESNTTSIRELVTSNKELSDSTRDIVAVWKAADGTIKAASAIGKFVKWLSGFAVLGVAFKWVFDHFK